VIHMEEKSPSENFETDKELVAALREHIGKLVLIRRRAMERSGILQRVSYDRANKAAYASFGQEEAFEINPRHRFEVRLDGVWKVLNPGDRYNWEL